MSAVNVRAFPGRKKEWRAQWRERVVKATGPTLRSRSRWFSTENQALAFQAKHAEEKAGFSDLALTATDRAVWWRVTTIAGGAGVDIEEALRAGIVVLRERVRKSENIPTALGLWELDAVGRKLRPATIQNVRRAVSNYAKGREETNVSEIRGKDLMAWVTAKYADQRSRQTFLTNLLSFFRWCAAEPREWVPAANFPAVRWKHRAKGEKRRVPFYSAREAALYLEAAPDNLKIALATGFFTGLRPFEMNRACLKWEEQGEFYGFDETKGDWHIAPQWAKTRAYRKLFSVPDCWWFWWIKYRHTLESTDQRKRKNKGKLVPLNYRNFRAGLSAARAAAGLRSKQDGIRHSFGTHGYHRSADGKSRGVEWCIALIGHTGGYRVFEQSYNGKVSDQEAESYFLNYPAGAACDVKTRARLVV